MFQFPLSVVRLFDRASAFRPVDVASHHRRRRAGSSVVESTASPLQPPLALHDAALPLQLVGSFLFSRSFPVDAQAHVPLLLQRQQLLKQFFHIRVCLGRRLHEGGLPGGGLSLAILRLHLTLARLIALVAYKHDGNGLHTALNRQNLQRYDVTAVRTTMYNKSIN